MLEDLNYIHINMREFYLWLKQFLYLLQSLRPSKYVCIFLISHIIYQLTSLHKDHPGLLTAIITAPFLFHNSEAIKGDPAPWSCCSGAFDNHSLKGRNMTELHEFMKLLYNTMTTLTKIFPQLHNHERTITKRKDYPSIQHVA